MSMAMGPGHDPTAEESVYSERDKRVHLQERVLFLEQRVSKLERIVNAILGVEAPDPILDMPPI